MREIPTTAVEVQTGLWADLVTTSFGSMTRSTYNLYSAEGYCFYDLNQPENYVDGDTSGELLPLEERCFAQYMLTGCTTIEQINARFVSVPVQDGYEIVSVGGNAEVM